MLGDRLRPCLACGRLLLLVFAVASCGGVVACAEPPPRELIIHAGLLLDGTGAAPRERQRLRVEDGVLMAIEDDTQGVEPASATRMVVDARDATVVPGFIDLGHSYFPEAACGLGERSLDNAVGSSLLSLAAGITSALAVDTQEVPLVALQRFVGVGRHRGPRLFPMGQGIEIRAPSAGTPVYPKSRVLPGGDVNAAAAAVADDVALGAAVLRVAVGPLDTRADEAEKTLCAALEAARRHDLRTLVLVEDDAGLVAAARCRAHAVWSNDSEAPSEAGLRLARDNDVTLVMHPTSHGLPLVVASGARLGIATGLTTCDAPRLRLEATLARMHERGVPAARIVTAATLGGAYALGRGDALGRIAVGHRGDLVVIEGDPLSEPAALTRVRQVIVEGVVQRPDLTRRSVAALWAWLEVLVD